MKLYNLRGEAFRAPPVRGATGQNSPDNSPIRHHSRESILQGSLILQNRQGQFKEVVGGYYENKQQQIRSSKLLLNAFAGQGPLRQKWRRQAH